MKILMISIGGLVTLVPLIITILSFVVYNNSGNKNKLLLFTLPNFILSAIIPIMIAVFNTYGNNYIYVFEAFINGIANGKPFMWLLFICVTVQIGLTYANGINLVKEKTRQKNNINNQAKVFETSSKTMLIFICAVLIISLFAFIDIIMLESNKQPIFCIEMLIYTDGGTKEYFGIGYKIIDYNKLGGYKGYKIGTWFMNYDNSL